MRLISSFFIVAVIIIFNNACMLPYNMMYGESAETIISEEIIDNKIPQEEWIVSEGHLHHPLAIEGGVQNELLFAGLPNQIKIYIEGSTTRHLKVTANGAILEALDVDKGIYSFFDNHVYIRELYFQH